MHQTMEMDRRIFLGGVASAAFVSSIPFAAKLGKPREILVGGAENSWAPMPEAPAIIAGYQKIIEAARASGLKVIIRDVSAGFVEGTPAVMREVKTSLERLAAENAHVTLAR